MRRPRPARDVAVVFALKLALLGILALAVFLPAKRIAVDASAMANRMFAQPGAAPR